ncbi:MAG: protein-L-isoaspartate(D-aspartate) O-methyltransferase [Planctomycetota bacterium]
MDNLAWRHMIEVDLQGRDIHDPQVLGAMSRVCREEFVDPQQRSLAYGNFALPIALGQTISQPYIVALMTQLVRLKPTDRALDVGCGTGYQAAVLAELVDHVYAVELREPLVQTARQRLQKLGYKNITLRHADGSCGWDEYQPYDVIVVGAAPQQVPLPLLEQLAPGGRLAIPVGNLQQQLLLIEKTATGELSERVIASVRFVPLISPTSFDPGLP